jgi:hypothetical protein
MWEIELLKTLLLDVLSELLVSLSPSTALSFKENKAPTPLNESTSSESPHTTSFGVFSFLGLR